MDLCASSKPDSVPGVLNNKSKKVYFTETFAPVVNLATVRFLLMMSILLGLSPKRVDYVAAFVQADIDTSFMWRCLKASLKKARF
jgi:hypothetical protein